MNGNAGERTETVYLHGLFRPRKYTLPDAEALARVRRQVKWSTYLTIIPAFCLPWVARQLGLDLSPWKEFLLIAGTGFALGLPLERILVKSSLAPYRATSTRATREEALRDVAARSGWGSLLFITVTMLILGIFGLGMAVTGDQVLFGLFGGCVLVGLAVYTMRVALAKHRMETSTEPPPPDQSFASPANRR